MAERFKALVLKTNVAHRVTVGSNPTPSAVIPDWGGARVVEWGRLLSGYPVTGIAGSNPVPPAVTQ